MFALEQAIQIVFCFFLLYVCLIVKIHVFKTIFTSMKKAFFQLHLAVLLAGFTGIFGKLIGMQEGMLVYWRIFLTIVFLGIWLWITGNFEKYPVEIFSKFHWSVYWLRFIGCCFMVVSSIRMFRLPLFVFLQQGFLRLYLNQLFYAEKFQVLNFCWD